MTAATKKLVEYYSEKRTLGDRKRSSSERMITYNVYKVIFQSFSKKEPKRKKLSEVFST